MEPRYHNTNIRYIEHNYEERLNQEFSVGDTVMIGPRYSTTCYDQDIYCNDNICGVVGKILDNDKSIKYCGNEYLVLFDKNEVWLYASRLILIRSAG